MANEILYMKLEQNVEIQQKVVFLKDIGKLVCKDPHILAKAKALKVYSFKENDKKRQVISVLKIIEMLQQIEPTLTIENIGETDVIIEWVNVNRHKTPIQTIKIIFVCLVCFFGTAYTVMSFHNDTGITQLLTQLYEMATGRTSEGYTILEFSYSIGLAVGIIVFFNHIGPRRITKDPTPVEVEFRKYEKDVNTSLIETADREGKSIDVS